MIAVILVNSANRTSNTDPNTPRIRYLLLGFAISMLFGALFSHLCLPRVQKRTEEPPHKFANLSLETLARGREVRRRRGGRADVENTAVQNTAEQHELKDGGMGGSPVMMIRSGSPMQ